MLYPQDLTANKLWRLALRKRALSDKRFRRAIVSACRKDILFFFNSLAWLFDPRGDGAPESFTTWSHQDKIILEMDKSVREALATFKNNEKAFDIVVEKSRDQGATWIVLWIIIYYLIFRKNFSVGIVTRDEGTVDSATNKGALLYKLDWALNMLPKWLIRNKKAYERNLTDHTIVVKATNSMVKGYAATGVAARGERHSMFFFDEFASVPDGDDWRALASTQYVTNCRIIVSTYEGDSNAYYHVVNDQSNALKLVLDWMDNPLHSRLLYKITAGKPYAKDIHHQADVELYWITNKELLGKLGRRGFQMEDRWRSPWYDIQCDRPGATPRSVAQELDRDPKGSVGKVVPPALLDKAKADHCRPPNWEGRVRYNDVMEIEEFIRVPGGPLKLWFEPDAQRTCPKGPYVIGGDIATGLGSASNSALCGINTRIGAQVMEYADPAIIPLELARLAVALARWLEGAFLAWEDTGPTGQAFRQEVTDRLHYGNVFTRKGGGVGWWNNQKDAKGIILEMVGMSIADGDFIPRSEIMLTEIGEYEWEAGSAVHKPSKILGTPVKSHGDRAIACGVCVLAARDRGEIVVDKSENNEQNPPYGTFAWRQKLAKEERQRVDSLSDDPEFTFGDLVQTGGQYHHWDEE